MVDVAGRTLGMITSGLLDRDHIIVPTTTLGAAIVRILEGEEADLGAEAGEEEGAEFASAMTQQGGSLYTPSQETAGDGETKDAADDSGEDESESAPSSDGAMEEE